MPRVFAFERRPGPRAAGAEGVTDADLERGYAQGRERVGTADEATLRAAAGLIRRARDGPWSKRRQTAAGAGAQRATCFDHDAATGRYREVPLRLRGDFTQDNLAPAARTLVRWLDSLAASAARGPRAP